MSDLPGSSTHSNHAQKPAQQIAGQSQHAQQQRFQITEFSLLQATGNTDQV